MNEKGLPLRIGDWKINEVARVYVVISFLAQAYIWGHRLEPVLSVKKIHMKKLQSFRNCF